ncbi:MAG: carbon monoxide dehydrogenase subunit G [Chloroflexi bacterium]|nr:carbon monoxide dehydrogenase subunit G [Chloroflexota bacterium]
MKVEGSYEINAGIDKVWAALNDPEILARMIPGATALEKVSENSYKASMNVGVGMIKGKFEGTIDLVDPVEPESYTLKVSGKGPGAFVNGTSDFKLTALSDTTTKVDVAGEAQVGGMLARVGQRLSGNAARSLMNQFFDNLKKNVAEK